MPRIQQSEIKPFALYGQEDIDLTISFRERLLTRFAAHETVEVKNIDNEPIEWQFLPDYAETSSLTDEGIKITYREEPELWRIEAGDTEYLTGACAFHMLENLYKKVVIKKVGVVETPTSAKQIRNFNFKDPIRAEAFIDDAFIGKVNPSFNQSQPNQVVPAKKEIKTKVTQKVG